MNRQLKFNDEKKPRLVRRGIGKRTKLCPKCLTPLKQAGSLSGWILPEEYQCPKCGYRGFAALERDEDEKDS